MERRRLPEIARRALRGQSDLGSPTRADAHALNTEGHEGPPDAVRDSRGYPVVADRSDLSTSRAPRSRAIRMTRAHLHHLRVITDQPHAPCVPAACRPTPFAEAKDRAPTLASAAPGSAATGIVGWPPVGLRARAGLSSQAGAGNTPRAACAPAIGQRTRKIPRYLWAGKTDHGPTACDNSACSGFPESRFSCQQRFP